MRYTTINPGLFRRNRRKLAGRLEKGSVALIHANDQMVRNGDQYYPYRQNSDLFYLSGIEQEMSVLMICPDHPDKRKQHMLFIRKPEPGLETWEGKKLDKAKAGKISGIEGVYWLEDFDSLSRPLILQSKAIYCSIPELEKFKPEYMLRDERKMEEMKKEYPLLEYKRLAALMTSLRLVKEPEELSLVKEAIGITGKGLKRILGFVKPGVYEYEVEAELSHEFIRLGGGGHAYQPIIASGGNACMLHYTRNDQICREGDLLLMDFGAEYANYASDCSRTIPINGRFSMRQKQLYNACLKVMRDANSLIKPGTTIEKVNEQVGKLWVEEHIKLGLYSNRDVAEQSGEKPLYRKFYPHGTSHFMGLDVHDVGSKQEVLQEGMLLTCEPGIYIADEGTGIRLENDIMITKNGNLDLMEDFPIEAEEIEELMNRAT